MTEEIKKGRRSKTFRPMSCGICLYAAKIEGSPFPGIETAWAEISNLSLVAASRLVLLRL